MENMERTMSKKRWANKSSCLTIVALMLCCLLVSSSPSVGEEKERLSLFDVIDLSFQNNPSYQIAVAEYELKRAREAYEEIKRPEITFTSRPIGYWQEELQRPSGEIHARYDLRDNLRVEVDFSFALEEDGLGFDSKIGASYSSQLFAPTISIETEHRPIPIEQALERRKNQLLFDATRIYYQLLKEINQIEIQEKTLEISIHQLKRAKAQGQSEAEILYAESEVDKAREALNKAMYSALKAREDLASFIGIPTSAMEVAPYYPPYKPILKPLEEWIGGAIDSSSLVHEQRRRLFDAEVSLAEALKDHGWDITLNLSHEYRPNLTGQREPSLNEHDTRASLLLRRSLYPPPSSLHIQELTIAIMRAEVALEAEKNRAQRNMEDLFRRAMALEERIQHLEERIQEGEEGLQREMARVEAGLSTPLQRRELELVLAELFMDLEHAFWDHHLARWEMMVMSGASIIDSQNVNNLTPMP